ncbi:SIS domain-containing protein [Cognatiyoonia sp. IB215446]|uniref:SIS domain-containing protein n=1 Tax=Cognatiyoonia sp. IB215446 TaxID=3097355 RepID=UPI002A0EFDA6|nr:SIS domain-containing protein [Cognatiyoonia sp. IB215446]MDX8348906.1 SIS domain-containing protein [Cognatiyoonia sp. IB215446]
MTQSATTQMAREIDEMPDAARRLATPQARSKSQEIAAALRELKPNTVITVARGSSDHAANYLSYAIQSVLGLPVASIGPSIHSVYGKELKMKGLAALAISQSGGSEDIAALCRSLARNGGHVVTLTNTPKSPLALAAQDVIDILAGSEHAVAATKSFFNSTIAGLWLIADWADDHDLAAALYRLPDCMKEDIEIPALDEVQQALRETQQTTIIARGAALGLAHEFALKLVETCEIHAASYSGAEVLHGPSAVLRDGYPVIALSTPDEKGIEQVLERLPVQGARVITLTTPPATGHWLVDPLFSVQPFYRLAERLSVSLGLDPDNPPHLRKVTKTL